MKEIGGYIEFPRFTGELMHGGAISLNSARNCRAYLIEAKNIKKLLYLNFYVHLLDVFAKDIR